ncbi:MAG: HesA/MoeB/ThiF family protein [Clostridia bacterium]
MKPRFKGVYSYFEIKPGVIRLGDASHSFELEDENGCIHKMLQLMDGQHTVEQLHQLLLPGFPDLPVDDVMEAVQELNQLGFLYDQAAEEQIGLTPRQRERFKGNLNYFSIFSDLDHAPGTYQAKLLQKKVTVLGMGAFGCSILFNLAGLGVKNVRIVDFDTVGLSNLNRQMLFNEADIGRPKIEVAKEFIGKFYSDMQLEAVSGEIRSTADVLRYAAGSDLVILAADQPLYVLPRWVNEGCVTLGIPYIMGGLTLRRGTFMTIIPEQTACLDCEMYALGEQHPDLADFLEKVMDHNFILPNMATSPTLQMTTGMIAAEAMKLMTGLDGVQSAGTRVEFDLVSFEKKTTAIARQQQCPTCGQGNGLEQIFHVFNKPEYQERSVAGR